MKIWIMAIFLVSCSGLEKAQQAKIRKINEVKDPILRRSDEYYFASASPKKKEQEKYPWEERYVGSFNKITKESFRCRGSSAHSDRKIINSDGVEESLTDCEGLGSHSLPVRDGEEFIYETLINLLNYLQREHRKRVIITSGYRCPVHNRYCNHARTNLTSKHQIGAEVDFYIDGMQTSPEEVVKKIMQYYQDDEPPYQQFRKMVKERNGVEYTTWYNKEIFININDYRISNDLDNNFPHPYITIELRIDRETETKIDYTWHQATNGYMRY